LDFIELTAVFGSILATTVLISLLIYSDYKIKSLRMELISKGVWKKEFDHVQTKDTLIAGSILVTIGVSVLIGTFWPGLQVWVGLAMSVGIALVAVGSLLVIYSYTLRT
jgi:hypothetical protein